MNRLFKIFLAMAGTAILAACGGGSDDPVDKYLGTWRSSCFSYVGNDGKTYFQTRSFNLARATSTSMNGTHSNTVAYSDPVCSNILGSIGNDVDVTIKLGPKANVLGGEVDSMSMTYRGTTYPGYMTANETQLFLVVTDSPEVIPSAWGTASPQTRIEAKRAVAPQVLRTFGNVDDHLIPANALAGYSR